MSALIETPVSAVYESGEICVTMSGGRKISFPVRGNPRLMRGSAAELNNIELSPFGLHWPDLDEDLSFAGILAGDYGQNDASAGQG